MNAAEAAVAEDAHDVAALRALAPRGRRWHPRRAGRRRLCPPPSSPASASRDSSRSSGAELFQARHLRQPPPRRRRRRRRPVRSGTHCAGSCCCAARRWPRSSRCGYLMPQRAQRLANRGRMMAEVVHHRHAAGDAAHFHAALDAFEGVERGLDLLVLQAAMLGAGDHRQRVAHVEFAHQVQVELEAGNLELGRRRPVADVEGLRRRCLRRGRSASPGNASR